jgi:holo-[acyl-carrier protein] synthase
VTTPPRILGHGIDLVEVARIAEMVREHGDRFLDRCFSPAERAHAGTGPRRDEHLAARFAAKEAVLKALGTGWARGIGWTDIEVVCEPSGRPTLVLTGRAEEIAAEAGVRVWHLSLTHTAQHAIASAIAEA